MRTEYVEQSDGGYFIKDSRVSLDSVVYAYIAKALTYDHFRSNVFVDA